MDLKKLSMNPTNFAIKNLYHVIFSHFEISFIHFDNVYGEIEFCILLILLLFHEQYVSFLIDVYQSILLTCSHSLLMFGPQKKKMLLFRPPFSSAGSSIGKEEELFPQDSSFLCWKLNLKGRTVLPGLS